MKLEDAGLDRVHIMLQWTHVAKWMGHWTQAQKVWVSIPTAGHV